MAIGDITYGNYTEADMVNRDHRYGPGYPFHHEGGQVYLITHLVPTMSGRTNYQAVVIHQEEHDLWMAENRPSSKPKDEDPGAGVAVKPPEPPAEPPVAVALEVPAEAVVEEVPEKVMTVEVSSGRPTYADFARVEGWSGRGRIPDWIKKKYEARFGPLETWDDRRGAQRSTPRPP